MKGQIRYYESSRLKPMLQAPGNTTAHSEFLRTGRISRAKPIWIPEQRQYLTHDEVAQRTGRKLETAGDITFNRINSFHPSIRLPKVIFHRTLDGSPHLGYCHVTAARTFFSQEAAVNWSFYIANFFSMIGEDDSFFASIDPQRGRMYFAVAIEGEAGQNAKIDRSYRKNGLLFQTSNPREAMRNVLMLGAPDAAIRDIIKRL